ncbi:MAG TPA: FHA domain-containing protein [Pseudonocardiaceae bacterium]|nr:FHA domain-containing protein [Pseudonocardiaceae bacterium]
MPSCPSGHDSTSADFCDVCGLAIGGAAPAAAAPTEAAPTPEAPELPAELCPVCGEPRTGRFCEGCSYDFVAGASKAPVVNQPVAEPAAPTPAQWSLLVTADREYFDAVRQQDGPDVPTITFPTYCPDREFTLAGPEVRIGRTSRSRGMVPEIDLTGPPQDPGVSHLHAVLLAQDDGGWALVDPGSTNGTTINDDLEPIANDKAVPVKDGDRIHVGAWTTLTVRGPSIG